MPKSKSDPTNTTEVKMSAISFRSATATDVPAKRTRQGQGSMYDPLLEKLAIDGPQVISTQKTVSGLRSGLTVWANKNNIKLSIRALEDPQSVLVSLARED